MVNFYRRYKDHFRYVSIRIDLHGLRTESRIRQWWSDCKWYGNHCGDEHYKVEILQCMWRLKTVALELSMLFCSHKRDRLNLFEEFFDWFSLDRKSEAPRRDLWEGNMLSLGAGDRNHNPVKVTVMGLTKEDLDSFRLQH